MMQNEKINSYQFLVLVIFFSIGTSILLIPAYLANEAKQDAWISAIIGTGIGLLVILLYCTIANWFPHLTYVQMNEKLFGKWIGKAISLLFVFMSFLFTSDLLYYSGAFLKIHAMPNTPMAALNILMALIIVMGVRLGIETIARSAELIILVFFALFLFLVVSVSPEIKIENIQPIFELGTNKIVQSSLFSVAVSSVTAIIFLMIFPSLINKTKQAKKSFLIGNLIGGIVIIITTFLCISVMGAEKTARELYPTFELAKKVDIGNFLQRIEGIMGTLWILTLYFKATLYFYASVLGLAQILNLKDYRPLTMPLGMIVVVLSLVVYPNVPFQQEWDTTTGFIFTLIIGLFFPLLMVIMYGIRRKQLKKES